MGPLAPVKEAVSENHYIDRLESLAMCLCTGMMCMMAELATAGIGFAIVYTAEDCIIPFAYIEQVQESI